MNFRRTACTLIAATALIAPLSACGSTDDDAAASSTLRTQPAGEKSSLQEYLLTADDFPGSTWQHIDQQQLKEQLEQSGDQQKPSDPVCAERLAKVEMRGGEADAIVAVPKGGEQGFTMQIASRPTMNLKLAEYAMTGRCASLTATTDQGEVLIEYTKVRTRVPGALVYRQTASLETTGTKVSETLIAYFNHDGVGVNLTSLSITSSVGIDAPSADVAEFTRILKRAVEVAEAA